ncbi:Atlastin-2 [Halotydeus destructor]|nr:Atlastin-2 [Halotydeus destructor]
MISFFKLALFVALSLQPLITSSSGQSSDEAIRIVQINEISRKFELNDKPLEAILLGPECRDKAISVISIAGATRKGKSFLLNFFLKYLSANDTADWLGDRDVPLKGFSWRGGAERDTTGILVWSKPFVVKKPNGQDVCVLLMDTQGAFDGKQTVADTAAIFAISTMTSSLQVYNLFTNIQEDDLQHLELFTEYGRMALEDTGSKPFQKLLFLVRDFRFPEDFDYGLTGGKYFLRTKLEASAGHMEELTRVRANIRNVFDKLECFLMPWPGEKVAMTKAFDGKINDISELFLRELQVLVPYLLKPENLEVKQTNGQDVTGKQLMEYFRAYIKIFTSGKLVPPRSIWLATAEADHLAASSEARDSYVTDMDKDFSGDAAPVAPAIFETKQAQAYKNAMAKYHGKKKMGGQEFGVPYLKELERTLSEQGKSYRSANRLKLEIEENKRRAAENQRQLDLLGEQYKEMKIRADKETKERTALGLARDHYITSVENQFVTTSYIDPNYLQQKHSEFLQRAEVVYKNNGGDMSTAGLTNLRKEINLVYKQNVQQNDLRKSVKDQRDQGARLQAELKRIHDEREALTEKLRRLQVDRDVTADKLRAMEDDKEATAKKLKQIVADRDLVAKELEKINVDREADRKAMDAKLKDKEVEQAKEAEKLEKMRLANEAAAQKMKELSEQAEQTNDELTRMKNMPRESSSGGFWTGVIAAAAVVLPFLG